MVIKRICAGVIQNYITRMPVPAMTPEVERIMVSGIVGLRPCDEIDQRLLVSHITLAPVGNSVFGGGCHPLRNMEKFGGLPVTVTCVVARTTICECNDLHIST